ncbi:hypothetical protein L345_12273, partial [Ophiophagus hannah]
NVFVVNLAIADLIVAIYPYPLVLTSVFHNGWNLGYIHCQLSGFLMGLSVIGSIFNITGIAINRYCYICHSLKYNKLYSIYNHSFKVEKSQMAEGEKNELPSNEPSKCHWKERLSYKKKKHCPKVWHQFRSSPLHPKFPESSKML